MRKLILALVLALTFATTGFAGIVECPPAPAPPPSAPETSTGITNTPPAAQNEPTDPVIVFALNLLQSVLF